MIVVKRAARAQPIVFREGVSLQLGLSNGTTVHVDKEARARSAASSALLKRFPHFADSPVGSTMLKALRETFPSPSS